VTQETPADDEIRIGVSSCLLGDRVRFDGGHKQDRFLTKTLAPLVRFVPVCPEIEVGMGVPRPSLRLQRVEGEIRLIQTKTGDDHTRAMRRFARRRVGELSRLDLSGFLLKKDSPSCGLFRVKLYDHNGVPSRTGRGLFAEELTRRLPLLPMEEEGRLHDPRLRENFFERAFGYRRLVNLFQRRWTLGQLVKFQTREKMLLRSHNETAYRELGRLVADARNLPRPELKQRYEDRFMDALRGLATTRRHTNVLQHMMGYFRKLLSPAERTQLRAVIEEYRLGLIPLIVPLTLVRHFVELHAVEYLEEQTYLSPHPKELMLRNHA
jgi:uncharacterized protein YbgA (DUF1722 family)/uncharacterized protein YbbK (DUF523 family)